MGKKPSIFTIFVFLTISFPVWASEPVSSIVESTAPATERYDPGNPLADEHGNVYAPNVNVIEEMTDMISASRAYQDNVEVMNTSKDLMLATLKLGE